MPAGLGEPVFDKLKADLAKALFSIPAVVGVEYGVGFAAARMRGSENNDPFVAERGPDGELCVVTDGNHHGGMLGGISSGMPIVLSAAVKPTSSLPREQPTVTRRGEATTVSTRGRHDPCLLPRFVPDRRGHGRARAGRSLAALGRAAGALRDGTALDRQNRKGNSETDQIASCFFRSSRYRRITNLPAGNPR